MLYTLEDARNFCAKSVGSGRCADDPEVVNVLNEATQLLLYEGDWLHTRRTIRLYVDNQTVAMPDGIEAVLAVNAGQWPGNVWNMAYEFMDAGPGTLSCVCNGFAVDLADRGLGWPTFFPIGPEPRQVMALSTEASDESLELHLRGLNSLKEEINPTGDPPGEKLRISRWKDGVEGDIDLSTLTMSTNSFQEITQVIKPVTSGHISFFARDPATNRIWALGKYKPYETQPGYRRYRVTGLACDQECCLLCLVKMGYIPLRHDTDLLTIQHLKALEMMCKAVHQFNHGDTQRGLMFQGVAVRMLSKQLTNANRAGPDVDFHMDEFAIGTAPNII